MIDSERLPSRRRMGRAGSSAHKAAAGLVVSVLGIAPACTADTQYFGERPDIKAAVIADGFEGTEVYWVSDKRTNLTLDIGSCSIAGVRARVITDAQGEVTDLHSYSFDGYAFPYVTSERRGGLNSGTREVIRGNPVTFEFDNLNDLTSNILGSTPCRRLIDASYVPE